MRFYVLSDLHLKAEVNSVKTEVLIKKLCVKIRACTSFDEPVLFIILGDVIDKGEELSFSTASRNLTLIRDELSDYKVKFEFVPGNHDLDKGSLLFFDGLISKFGSTHSYERKSTYSSIYDGVNFIFTDSTLYKDYSAPGKLDIEAIHKEVKPSMQNVLFCHHALFHKNGGSHDVIENREQVYTQLNSMGISFLFHGHVHRTDVTIPENGLVEIGFGSFSGDIDWMNSVFHQFGYGCIRDGKIVLVERWVAMQDGHDDFPSSGLYPKPQKFADPNEVDRYLYNPVEGYIPRTVSSYEEARENPVLRVLSEDKRSTLREIVQRNKKILLLCDAGMGKSVELENLAHELSTRYHTYLYSLSNYVGQNIRDLLPATYKNLAPSRIALLLDGYDELSNSYFDAFVNNIKIYSEENPEVTLVISSRSNFCGKENGNKSRTFDGFYTFVLDQVSHDKVLKYLESYKVDVAEFWEEVGAKKVQDLLYNPFYLTRLIKLYIKEKELPNKRALMDKLVSDSFESDELKFPGNLDEHYYSLFTVLESVAFTMQLMQKQGLDDRTEYQRLFDIDKRELLKKSGLFKREGSTWQFLHNNFREYLAARLLSKLSKEDVVSVLFNEVGLRPHWVNTLGYLTGFDLQWNLVEVLVEKEPSALVKFESDRLNGDARSSVFKLIFEKYEELRIHIDDDLCDAAELARFSDSNEILSYLLERIQNPRNTISQYTALNILRHYPRLFDKHSLVRNTLLSVCEGPQKADNTVCRLAMMTLCQKKLYNEEVTRRLLQCLGDESDHYIRLGLYEYLQGAEEHNNHVQYFLSGIKYINYGLGTEEIRVINEAYELTNGLKRMSTVESVSLVLEFFSGKSVANFHDSQEVLTAVTKTAVRLYKEGHTEIYDVVLKCYIDAVREYNTMESNVLVKFFLDTRTQNVAALSAAECFEEEVYHVANLIYSDEGIIDYLKDVYVNGKLKSHRIFHNIVISFVRDMKEYEEYACLIKTIDNIDIPEFRPVVDYDAERRKSAQEYFDILLDDNKRHGLFQELISVIDDPELMVNQLLDMEKDIEYNSLLWRLRTSIYHYSKNIRVADFFKLVDEEMFIIWSASHILALKPIIFVADDQRIFLEKKIESVLKKICFKSCVTYSANGLQVPALISELLSLILHFDYPLTEDALLDMTEFPTLLFKEGNERKKYEYLEKKVPIDKLKRRLLQNVETKRVHDMVLKDHLEFFDKCKDASLAHCAIEICKTRDDELLHFTAWQYLYHTLGQEYIANEVLPIAEAKLLMEIDGICKDIPRSKMQEAMEREYEKCKCNIDLQAHLICLGSRKAIEDYVSKTSSEMSPPEQNLCVDGPTTAISTIRDPVFLPQLEILLSVVLEPTFKDCSWRGLRNTLPEALENCGMQAYEETISAIMRCCPLKEENAENYSYCNYIIKEIERRRKKLLDAPISLDDAMRMMNQMELLV